MVIEWPNRRFSFRTPLAGTRASWALVGAITALAVYDPTESAESTPILEADDPFSVQIRWELSGPAVSVVGGTWHVELYLQEIGGSRETRLGPVDIPVVITGDPTTFEADFNAPPVDAGLYRLAVSITHSPAGMPNELTGMGGVAEVGDLEVLPVIVEEN